MELLKDIYPASEVVPSKRRWRVRARGEEVRNFILSHVEKHNDIAHLTAEHFNVSRQAANKHLQKLVAEGALLPEGKTRYRRYKLAALLEWMQVFQIIDGLEEDRVWSQDIAVVLGSLPHNVMQIWQFCVTEMLNNAIDHSGGSNILVRVGKTATNTQIMLADNGIGIF